MQNLTQTRTQVADSPIARLNEDILWNIFLENTETSNDRRLITARHSSQVCLQWRTILLRSSSVWGKCIDLRDLRQTNHKWFQEVLYRTGDSSLLWITGPIGTLSNGDPPPYFLFTFINDNWGRIQRLNISDAWLSLLDPDEEGGHQALDFDDRTQYWNEILKKPAPILEEFVFHYSMRRRSFVHDASKVWIVPSWLFFAPALKKFEVYKQSRFKMINFKFAVNMPASWSSKLRTLTIRQSCDINQVLSVLATTPLLEDLEIQGSSTSTELRGDVPQVSLPKLISLRLNTWSLSGPNTLTFLQQISPAVGCCLSMSKPNEPETLGNSQDNKRVQVLIMRYVQDYFEHRLPTQIALSSNDHLLEVNNTSIESAVNWPGFSVWMPLSEDDSVLIQVLFNATFFSKVDELDLRDWLKGLPLLSAAFDSVTTLWIEYESLVSLLEHVEQGYQSLFLQVTIIKMGHPRLRLDSECREPLERFLKHRRAINRPISVLDLSPSYKNLTCNLDNLEDLAGLLVRWSFSWGEPGVVEYVCGNGHPDILRFKQNYPNNGGDANIGRYRGRGRRRLPYSPAKEGWSGQFADL